MHLTEPEKNGIDICQKCAIELWEKEKMKKIIDINEKFLEAARGVLAEKMPWEKNITTKQTVNAALSFYAAFANKKG